MAGQPVIGPTNHRRRHQNFPFYFLKIRTRRSKCLLSEITILLIYLILTTVTASSDTPKNECKNCDQGKCSEGTCVCLPGFRGSNCNECYGRVRLQPGRSGIIYDGAADYEKNLACSWLLDAGQNNMRIQFEFNSFSTECSWDHLYIHNGDSSFAPVVAAFSGIMGNSSAKPQLKFQLTGRYVFVHWYSDAAYTLPGFNVSYTFDDCDLECSDNGVCNNSICECKPGWSGQNCELLDEGCLYNCSEHGSCQQGICHCDSGYKGEFCDVNDGDLYVEAVDVVDLENSSLSGRASAALVYDGSEALWLFGGYQMGDEQIENNLFKFMLNLKEWQKVMEVNSASNPWPRYGHSVVYYKDAFYLFGGVNKGKIKADLWTFNVAAGNWTQLVPSPRDLSGHTAHVVNNKMVVIFGYSSLYSYSNKILEYNFDTGLWTIVKTGGALPLGGYGHTSVHDTQRGKIYVSGGYFSLSLTAYNLTDRLYQYDPIKRDWFILRNSRGARYLHSAAMINGLMVTFGGSMHNNSQLGIPAKCSASDFMVYDRDCNSWHSLPPRAVDYSATFDRFGHSMVTVDSEIYLFGGFSAVVKKDLYKIVAGNCSYFKDKESCEGSLPGVKCSWNTGHCEVSQQGEKKCGTQDQNAECSGYNTCASCLGSPESCHWCGNVCISSQSNTENCSKDIGSCSKSNTKYCSVLQNCKSCEEEKVCSWGGHCGEKPPKRCSDYKTCFECNGAEECGWCADPNTSHDGTCSSVKESTCPSLQWFPYGCPSLSCLEYKTCAECRGADNCGWCAGSDKTNHGSCINRSNSSDSCQAGQGLLDKCPDGCDPPCSAYSACGNCTTAGCMWCSNPMQCIDTNSYVASFHYGQCKDWATKSAGLTCLESYCNHRKSCSECQANPKCGWCSDETNTGTGVCYDGSMAGPLTHTAGGHAVDRSVCPAGRWYFNDCPKCQCNGHSTCINDTSTCKSCDPPTTGPQCQFCANGYHGDPKYGAGCKVCSCNGQAETCDHRKGDCYCRTRGVIGKNCESCDDKNKYTGNPKNGGTCYYRLTTDFQYTFNLSKPEDQNYTTINFVNTPTSSDRDVDFTLNCSTQAFINITYKSKSSPEETEYVSGRLCDYFRTKFEHKKHAFGGNENTTFMVYVYDFKTPFLLQISFVQQEKINLYKFFIIFFSCFLALILLVAAAWKIKHKVESYRRGRRLEVEMQQMARRPFSTIAVEIEKKSSHVVADRKDHLDSVLRRRKKQMGNKPSSIAIEPLKDNKAAILTLLIQLPTGNSDYAPSGNSGLAVGSALVSIGSNRKQSLEHIKGDRPKIRKNLNYNHPDVCA